MKENVYVKLLLPSPDVVQRKRKRVTVAVGITTLMITLVIVVGMTREDVTINASLGYTIIKSYK
jgi:hypothetical protein